MHGYDDGVEVECITRKVMCWFSGWYVVPSDNMLYECEGVVYGSLPVKRTVVTVSLVDINSPSFGSSALKQ